jgi:nucleoside-diphosphate-sugar epimerase
VLVVGAGGRTGSLVLEKLLSRKERFVTKGLVRGEKSVGKVQKGAPSANPEDFVFADITDATALTKAIKVARVHIHCKV